MSKVGELANRIETHMRLHNASPGFHLSDDDFQVILSSLRSKRGQRERRWDQYGPFVKMAEVDGWLLVRRPRCMPAVMNKKDWDKLRS